LGGGDCIVVAFLRASAQSRSVSSAFTLFACTLKRGKHFIQAATILRIWFKCAIFLKAKREIKIETHRWTKLFEGGGEKYLAGQSDETDGLGNNKKAADGLLYAPIRRFLFFYPTQV
jgi:hypothetical protein